MAQAKVEYVTPEGLRLDGRRPHELRRMQSRMGVLCESDGSAYVEMGNTKVLVAVYGPREVRHRGKAVSNQDHAVLNCEYSMATFSSGERRRRTRGDRYVLLVGFVFFPYSFFVKETRRCGGGPEAVLRGGGDDAALPALADRHLRPGSPGGRQHNRSQHKRDHPGHDRCRNPHARLPVWCVASILPYFVLIYDLFGTHAQPAQSDSWTARRSLVQKNKLGLVFSI